MEAEEVHRRMFRDESGRLDFTRLVENLAPTAIVGLLQPKLTTASQLLESS